MKISKAHQLTPSMALAVTPLGEDGLLDPILRLLRLLDEPAHIPALAPLIEREILYRLARSALKEFAVKALLKGHCGLRQIPFRR